MQENKINNIICWMAVVVYCLCCIYFGLIRDREDDNRFTLWESVRYHAVEEFQILFSPDPFWSVFSSHTPQLYQCNLLRALSNDASIYSAKWHLSSGYIDDVNYYCDKKGNCVIVTYVEYDDVSYITPYSEWYYINLEGLLQFDSAKLIGNLFLVIAVFILPWLLLIKIAIDLHKSIKNSNFATY